MIRGVEPLHCRECGRRAEAPDVVPYLVTGAKGKFIHVWLHPACSETWMKRWREWRAGGEEPKGMQA